jgi:hypothetical protein
MSMAGSPIFVKAYALLKWLLPQTERFPKSQRFLLAKRIEDAALAFHERILRAGRPDGSSRDLIEADVELAKLRVYLRLAGDLRLISVGQYEHGARMVDEIGRLLGGWLKQSKREVGNPMQAGELFPA